MLGRSGTDASGVRWAMATVVFVLGVGLLAYGVGRSTGALDWRLPPVAYFAVAVVLFAHAALQFRRL
ncbi:hypothetical protein [Halorientalis regularis]|jgi:hypothetical protein|uniref:Uncharacterized protein n=1 Tax=Halorientalis regularis TaxID=660518 RepID=A0A1G7K7I5_9EURY|nr:hypothetical protein [Halorientalis regularis]SDF33020.1 hypothetical protein SAMN05216218_105197 [Halorientalis regularis]